MSLNNNDKCNGQCLIQTFNDGNENHYIKSYECGENCVLIKCPNYIICGSQLPQWVFCCHDNLCVDCDMIFGKWNEGPGKLNFQEKLCLNCNEEKLCTKQIKCDNFLCVDCLKKLYFKENDEDKEDEEK